MMEATAGLEPAYEVLQTPACTNSATWPLYASLYANRRSEHESNGFAVHYRELGHAQEVDA